MNASRPSRLPPWLVVPLLAGATAALAGGYWDDAWHTERGRDSFFIAPHVAIYAGISLAGGALALWAALVVRARGWRRAMADRVLGLALVSVSVTLASAPIDNAWHLAFGRDAVIWSPPHLLGILGTAGLAVALLVELVRNPARWARALEPWVGGLVLAPFAFVVIEYQTDVPQFDVLWYLPVLTLVSALALSLVQLATGRPFAATQAAGAHLVFSLAVTAYLWSQGFDRPAVPLVIVPALALDLARQHGVRAAGQALAFTGALFAAYVPALDLIGHGVRLDALDVLGGVPLAALSCLGVIAATSGSPPRLGPGRKALVTGGLALMLTLGFALPAVAHDPGQGPDAGELDLTVVLSGKTARLGVSAPPDRCDGLRGLRIVARRAGEERSGELAGAGCRFHGAVVLPEDGRWFVYADLRRGDDTIEAWLPVRRGTSQRRFVARDRFAYVVDREPSSTVKWVSGIVIYCVVAAFLVALVVLVRRAGRAGAVGSAAGSYTP